VCCDIYIEENDTEQGGGATRGLRAEVEGNKYLTFAGEELPPHLAAGGGN
jgi:hypothetical protein